MFISTQSVEIFSKYVSSTTMGIEIFLKASKSSARISVASKIMPETPDATMSSMSDATFALSYILDRNMLQITGCTEDVMALESLADKYRAFGWSVREIDGNNMEQIVSTLDALPFEKGKPSLILAHTVKGKGICFAENQAKWHHGVPSHEQYSEAAAMLEAQRQEMISHAV